MKRLFSLLSLVFISLGHMALAKQTIQSVDLFIGTAHARWLHFAPGAMPFGMAKPGPSTNGSLGNKSGWEAPGYDFRDHSIESLPNFHEFQIGGISLMA